MNRQQKEVQQQFLNNEKTVLKKLESNYKDALDEINDRIAILQSRNDADLQHVIYQIEYQKVLKAQVQAILDQLHNNNFETVSEYLTKSYEDGFVGTMYDLQGQGIPLVFPIDQEQVVDAIQHETKLSESLYSSLGKDTKVLSRQIAGEISRGISNAAMYSEIARNIAGYAGISKNKAMRIARTEAHRIQCKATADAQWKAKEKGADVVKQWDASLDDKTRDTHRQLDGQIRELDEPFEVQGMTAMQPGGFGDPSEDCNCRCALLQRARWALGDDYTKWSPDAPVLVSDDGITQFVKIEAKDYNTFKETYQQLSLNLQFFATNKLNNMDIKSIYDYMSSKSYVVNEKLRTGGKLSDAEQKMINNLNKALDKMPKYEGNLQRSLFFYNEESVNEFLKDYKVGETIDYKEFLSTTKGGTYNPEGQVQIFIQDAKNGRDISSFNKEEQEVLYKNNSTFNVLNIVEHDGKHYILLGEKENERRIEKGNS